jgi:hypothetical protein
MLQGEIGRCRLLKHGRARCAARGHQADVNLLYEFGEFMQSRPPFPASLLYLVIAAIPVVLVHELGHAAAARRMIGGDVRISVGNAGKIADLRLGEIEVAIHAIENPLGPPSSASVEWSRATTEDVVSIALAGPLASAYGVALTALLFSAAPAAGFVHDVLWAALFEGIFLVLNVMPVHFQDRRGGTRYASDGRVALDAIRAARAVR